MPASLRSLKRGVSSLYLLAALGLVLELLLLGHLEPGWQLLPVPLLALATLLLCWQLLGGKPMLFLLSNGLLGIAGLIGIGLHLTNNREFELELQPNQDQLTLLAESLTGALPVLAPGALIMLGLLGYLYHQLATLDTKNL